ncbi:MAG TPA: hypothetical protein VFJ64_10920 [Solirubrobacterales bacterium]|nr:hypothetical protein [Solirubrobacterales bacterium]
MSGAPLALALALLAATAPPAQAAQPSIPSAWVTSVTATSATLRAKVDPEGQSTTYRFEYLSEAAYEANLKANPKGDGFGGAALAPVSGAASAGSGSEAVAVSQHLSALSPLTAYRYRAVASSAAGTAIGPVHLFATEAPTNASEPLDGRGWEMVSPVDKAGGAIGAPGTLFGGGDFQAAAAGGALTYGSATAFGEAAGAPPVSQYLSIRSGSGWSTENVSAPLQSGAYGDEPDGAPFRVFATDLSRALMLNGVSPPGYSLFEGGAFTQLPKAAGLHFEGASPDLHHIVFATNAGLHQWSGGALEAISATPGAALAAPIGAISADGSRVYLTEGEDGPLKLREGGVTKTLPETTGTGAAFAAASADGALAYYTAGGALYRYEAEAGAAKAIATSVIGVLAVSPSGADVYYQDTTGLKRWHEGTTATIVAGASVATAGDRPPATATARVSADGAHLAFLSKAQIPPFDNLDAKTEAPDTELYLWGPPPGGGAPRLACASCNPSGERPAGSASIPGAQANGTTLAYKPRALSADGQRVFFDTADKLVSQDTDSRVDVYEWEAQGEGSCTRSPGCVALISGGRGEGGSFVDASEDGTDAFFLTEESLLGSDPGSADLYDARAGGGFPEASQPIPCVADACQPLPSPPEDPTPGTLTPTAGNPPAQIVREGGRRRKHHRHRRRVKTHGPRGETR